MPIRVAKAWESRERDVTPEALWLRRRELLQGAALAAGTLLLPSCGRTEAGGGSATPSPVVGPDGFRTDEQATDFEAASGYNNFYEFGTDKEDPARHAGGLVPRPWSVARRRRGREAGPRGRSRTCSRPTRSRSASTACAASRRGRW